MRIGAAQREVSRGNSERLTFTRVYTYVRAPRADWLRRYSATVLPIVAHVLYKYYGDGRFRWLGEISACATTDGGYLYRFLDDTGTDQASLPSRSFHDFRRGLSGVLGGNKSTYRFV